MSEPQGEKRLPLRLAREWPWLVVLLLTGALTVLTTTQALERYRDFRLGWSWDLAYYNQWYWALTMGDGRITVRPSSAYAEEGPSVWKMNYLAPVRFLFVPVYRLAPDPRTLLVLHNVFFWWVVPAAFMLLRAETPSNRVALVGTLLVPLTPLLWPLAWNDFRELQLAIPFVLWGVQGVRARSVGLSAIGVGGLLACRQEMALVAASFALIPPREPEDIGRSVRWAHTLVVVGLAWFLFGFFGYLRFVVSPYAVEHYLDQFDGPKASLGETLQTSAGFLGLGLGAWAVFLLARPRMLLLVVPWVWTLANGRWSLRFLGEERWHEVRYTVPMVGLGLAAGLIGFGRVASWLLRRPRGTHMLVMVGLLAAVVSASALWNILERLDQVPRPIDAAEARALRGWIAQVKPGDGVLAHYDVCAPLSSRKTLYSYVLGMNAPPKYPTLPESVRWIFYRNSDGGTEVFEKQGFRAVHRGRHMSVLQRNRADSE